MLEVDLVSLKPALVRRVLRASHHLKNHQIKEKLELSGNERGCFSPSVWLSLWELGTRDSPLSCPGSFFFQST